MATRKRTDNDAADRALGRALRRVLVTMKGPNEKADLAADRKARSAIGRDIRRDKKEVAKRPKPKRTRS